ncbi:MAG: hypothetical protein AAF789_12455 [Bacteroidota bacterium]
MNKDLRLQLHIPQPIIQLFFLLVCIPLWSCEEKEAHLSYGYFASEARRPTSEERQALKETQNIHKIYIPAFEVDWDWRSSAPIPLHSSKINYDVYPPGYVCVPVIKVSSRVLEKLSPADLNQLAEQFTLRIQSLTKEDKLKEILLEFTWTEETYGSYSNLIQQIKSKLPVSIGISIPLHYFRHYATTGVPPADYIVLQLHNELALHEISENASIISPHLLQPWLMPFSQYPLSIEVVIPGGTWGIVIRENEPLKILPALRREMFDDPYAFRFLDEFLIKVQRDTYFQGYYFKKGDFIRLDVIRLIEFKEVLQLIRPFITMDTLQLNLLQVGPEGKAHLPLDSLQSWMNE